MLTKKPYSVIDMLRWTHKEIFIYLFFMIVITILYDIFGFTFLRAPWTPIALIGTAVVWVFQTMERIGRVGENPFEGTSNNVPISTIAGEIEIDIRQMMVEDNEIIPKQFPEKYNVQM